MSQVMSGPARIPGPGDFQMVFGDQTWVPFSGKDTGNTVGVLVALMPPESGPGPHIHHGSDELFYVVKGRFRFQVGDQVLEVTDGAMLFVPRGVPHGFMNIGDETGHVVAAFTPAGPELVFVEAPTWPPGQPDPEMLADLGRRTQSERLGHPIAKVAFGW